LSTKRTGSDPTAHLTCGSMVALPSAGEIIA